MSVVDPSTPLTVSTGNLARRRRVDRAMRGSSMLAAAIAVAILAIVVISVASQGLSQISWAFLTKDPTQTLSGTGGGIASEIVGTAAIVAVATAMALPVGVLIAIFLTEFSTPRTARPVRLALDLLNGLPSIVIAVFVFGLLVSGSGQTGFAASFALMIIMIPLIARTTSEMLLLVPRELRDASYALGISRWRTILGIVMPSTLGGVLTGVVLAVARAAGETAPVLLLSSIYANGTTVNVFGVAVPNIPMEIFTLSQSGVPSDHARAWGAALVLIFFILVGNLSARAMLARQRRKLATK
jgi:phosphate transport system permease protein